MNTWQLQEAKTHFSDVIRQAINQGPQMVTLHGKPSVVLLSAIEYEQLTQPKKSFVEFMQDSPLKGIELDLDRAVSEPRAFEL